MRMSKYMLIHESKSSMRGHIYSYLIRTNSSSDWYYKSDLLTNTKSEKTRKYDLIANELALIYKCKVKIIPYVMTWKSGSKCRKNHSKVIVIKSMFEAYRQSLVLKKTLESISFERRRGRDHIQYKKYQ